MMEHTFSNPTSAERLLAKAAIAMQVQLELTGVLGKRTVHQVDAKAQMVVVPKRAVEAAWVDTDDDEDDDEGEHRALQPSALSCALHSFPDVILHSFIQPTLFDHDTVIIQSTGDDIMDGPAMSELADTMAELAQVEEGATEEEGGGEEATKQGPQKLKGLAFEGVTGASDILPRAALEGDDAEAAAAIRLRSVEQAYCLAACISFKKAKGADDLAAWTMQPYVDAVTAHAEWDAHARPMLQSTCHLLTARHERERPRTRERAMLLMEQLVDGFHSAEPCVAARVRYVFAVWFPPQLLLRKEVGEPCPAPQFLLPNSGHVVGGLSTFYSLTRYAHPPTRESALFASSTEPTKRTDSPL